MQTPLFLQGLGSHGLSFVEQFRPVNPGGHVHVKLVKERALHVPLLQGLGSQGFGTF